MKKSDGIGQFVQVLIDSGKSVEIFAQLEDLEVTPCVVRDWDHEPRRRMGLEQRRLERVDRKARSKFGQKGEDYRRIIWTKIIEPDSYIVKTEHYPSGRTTERTVNIPGREYQFHASKGRRSYRHGAR